MLHEAGMRLRRDDAVDQAWKVTLPAAVGGVPDPAWLSAAAPTLTGDEHPPRRRELATETGMRLKSPQIPSLTHREQDVLGLLGQRRTDIEIADQLFISPKTVSSHVSSILAKLGAKNRREAAAMAVRFGLI